MAMATLLASAQISSPKKLVIGDTAPANLISKMHNYPKDSASVADFKGKILIVDMWNIYCTACVASWPKLLKLQEKFKDKIQIVIMNYDNTKQQILDLVKKQEAIHGYKMTLPIAYGNKDALATLVPEPAFPHVFFITTNGVIKYISSGEYLQEKILQELVEGKSPNIPLKDDYITQMDENRPFFLNGNSIPGDTSKQNIRWTSFIMPYQPTIVAGGGMLSYNSVDNQVYIGTNYIKSRNPAYGTKSFTRAYYGCTDARGIFSCLYGESGDGSLALPKSRVIFENIDSTKLVYRIDKIPHIENIHAFQFIAQQFIPQDLLTKKMILDAEIYFGVKTQLLKRKKKCIVIERNANALTTYTGGDRKEQIGFDMMKINKMTVKEILGRLLNGVFHFSNYPLVDETHFAEELGLIEIETTNRPLGFELLKSELKNHGIDLSIQEREVDMLVISPAD